MFEGSAELELLVAGPSKAGKQTVLRNIARRPPPTTSELRLSSNPKSRLEGALDLHPLPARFRMERLAPLVLRRDEGPLHRCQGVLFVADARPGRSEENMRVYEGLEDKLRELGRNPEDIPIVFLINRTDLSDSMDPDELAAFLNKEALAVPGIAHRGIGVQDAFEGLLRGCAWNSIGMPAPKLRGRRLQLAACDQSWSDLQGNGSRKRHCPSCHRTVLRPRDSHELTRGVERGHCIALTSSELIPRRDIELRGQQLPRSQTWPCFIEYGLREKPKKSPKTESVYRKSLRAIRTLAAKGWSGATLRNRR